MAVTAEHQDPTMFSADEPEVLEEDRFRVDVDGFEGPLDLLLELARRQKVDLQKISILALAEQYLAFVEAARSLRLELAADYLVMAAWLAYLKSRLLLPQSETKEEPPAEDLAAALAERLRRLENIRAAAAALEARPRLGRELFLRGMPDLGLQEGGPPVWKATIYDLLAAYARQRQKHVLKHLTLRKRQVWSLVDARDALQRIVGDVREWAVLDTFLLAYCTTPEMARTVRASSLSVTLELVKEGRLVLRQDRAFAPLWIKTPASAPAEDGRVAAVGMAGKE